MTSDAGGGTDLPTASFGRGSVFIARSARSTAASASLPVQSSPMSPPSRNAFH